MYKGTYDSFATFTTEEINDKNEQRAIFFAPKRPQRTNRFRSCVAHATRSDAHENRKQYELMSNNANTIRSHVNKM